MLDVTVTNEAKLTPVSSEASTELVAPKVSATRRISVDRSVVPVAIAATFAIARISVLSAASVTDITSRAAVRGMPVLRDAITVLDVSEAATAKRIPVDRSVTTVVTATAFAMARISVSSAAE